MLRHSLILLLWALAWAQDAGFELPEPGKGQTIALEDAELVRNGDFAFGAGAWSLQGGLSTTSTDAALHGAPDEGAYLLGSSLMGTHAAAMQEIYLPQRVDAARLRCSWRLHVDPGVQASLGGFSVVLAVWNGEQWQTLATLCSVDAQSYPGADWQHSALELDAAGLEALNLARKEGRRCILWAQLESDMVVASLDAISLRVDGQRVVPALSGCLAWTASDAHGKLRVGVVNPDGSGARVLWQAARESASLGLAWRPDGQALVFSSDHELAWSAFNHDIYQLDAGGVRRLTNAPSLAWLEAQDLPTGVVEVELRNLTGQNQALVGVYVQGALKPAFVSLAPYGMEGSEQTVRLDVCDLGLGVGQYVCARIAGRSLFAANTVDVEPGKEVVHAGGLGIAQLASYSPSSPSFRFDGAELCCTLAGLARLPAEGGVPETDAFGGVYGFDPVWSPRDERLLYCDTDFKIRLWQAEGEPRLLPGFDGYTMVGEPSWLPDASGFVCSLSASPHGNVLYCDLDGGPPTPVTDVFNERLGSPCVSPDGQYIACVRILPSGALGREQRELWVMRGGQPGEAWRLPVEGDCWQVAWRP